MRAKVIDAEFAIVQDGRPLRRRPWWVKFTAAALTVLGKTLCIGLVALVVGWVAIFGFGADDRTLAWLRGPAMFLGLTFAAIVWDWLSGLWARHQAVDRLRSHTSPKLGKERV